jgi:hypothetical protein
VDATTLSVSFQLLALEARARLVESDAERGQVRNLASALPRVDLDADGEKRLEAVIERLK